MLKKIMTTLRWSLSIGNKFFRVVPRGTLIIVIATLVSQFSILLAFLLPLKIIMLLGSDGIPRYFPSFFAGYDQDVLVIALSLTAIGFYFAYFVSEKIISFGSLHGASLLLKKSHKMTLFENQEEIASRGFQRYSRSLASSVFLLLVAAALAWLYLGLLIFLISYILLAFFVTALLYTKGEKFKASLDLAPGPIVTTATNIGFLLAFGFMVTQFLIGNPPSLLIAIISLILMRQGFSRITGIINDLRGLYGQRFKLNALFFHGHVLIDEPKKHEVNFWSLFRSPQREEWVLEILQNVVSEPIDRVGVQWFQLGIPNIVAFRVVAFDSDENAHSEYLVKLFNANRSSLAKHEATLLAECASLPAFKLLSVDEMQGFHCHIMQWHSAKKVTQEELLEVRRDITASLIALEPEAKLVSRFIRSRPPLWQRVDCTLLERLKTVAEMVGEGHVRNVEILFTKRHEVMAILKNLPLVIVNPELGPDAILRTENKDPLSVHWGRWSLEPVGAGWPIHVKEMEHLAVVLDEAKGQRYTLKKVRKEDVWLSALVFSLERLYVRQQFVSALKLIPRILKCLELNDK